MEFDENNSGDIGELQYRSYYHHGIYVHPVTV